MLRRPVGATASTTEAVLASAGVAAILSAICAMIVPRPTMNAAKIIMLRITPHSIRGTCNITTSAAKPRLTAAAKAAILTKRMSEVLTEARQRPRFGGYLLTFERRHRRNQRLFSLKISREIANRGRHHG